TNINTLKGILHCVNNTDQRVDLGNGSIYLDGVYRDYLNSLHMNPYTDTYMTFYPDCLKNEAAGSLPSKLLFFYEYNRNEKTGYKFELNIGEKTGAAVSETFSGKEKTNILYSDSEIVIRVKECAIYPEGVTLRVEMENTGDEDRLLYLKNLSLHLDTEEGIKEGDVFTAWDSDITLISKTKQQKDLEIRYNTGDLLSEISEEFGISMYITEDVSDSKPAKIEVSVHFDRTPAENSDLTVIPLSDIDAAYHTVESTMPPAFVRELDYPDDAEKYQRELSVRLPEDITEAEEVMAEICFISGSEENLAENEYILGKIASVKLYETEEGLYSAQYPGLVVTPDGNIDHYLATDIDKEKMNSVTWSSVYLTTRNELTPGDWSASTSVEFEIDIKEKSFELKDLKVSEWIGLGQRRQDDFSGWPIDYFKSSYYETALLYRFLNEDGSVGRADRGGIRLYSVDGILPEKESLKLQLVPVTEIRGALVILYSYFPENSDRAEYLEYEWYDDHDIND
ncbi:MAG: hypothetical protein IKN57_00875, partial [Parasporobacterium sp.]|nr:hypothetical protein [Parasporobacterium sp.]